ncbi:MAG: hypothetical protein KAH23_04495 [Kiritimatiellae bacterium]|nr:hypothetical protein [Kiritimatiellia bacterium]
MNRVLSFVMIVIAVACFSISGSRHASLVQLRARYNLNSNEPLENAPPLMAFTTIVLGGFRGLIADVLWLRVSTLKENGKYVELVQLSDWITKLEPRASEVWEFHAWNMAYNVSVMMPEPEDRWRWVKSGIQLIRDGGLYYNPADARLHWYMGWLFQHKIGTPMDNMHVFYKEQWAEEIAPFLDGSRPAYARLAQDAELNCRMKNEYRLMPDIMKEIEKKYGLLDWRRPETHAIYWAYCGKRYADGFDLVSCNRMIIQCLKELRKRKE